MSELIRTDVTKGEFSPTGVQTARCLRKFYLSKVLKIKPIQSTAPLVYGSAIHAGVEKFYGLRSKGISLPEIQMEAVKSFVAKTANLPKDKIRTVDGGIITLNNYCAHYYHDTASFKLADIESAQWLPMPNGTTLLAKMDRVLSQGSQIVLVDTKTTSSYITDWYFRQFENQLQVSLYAYVVASLLGRCDSIQIDAIKIPFPSARSTAVPFSRATFIRTELQIEEAIRSYCRVTDYIMSVLARPEEEQAERMFCNQSMCNDYDGCPYLPICKYGLDHPAVTVDFEREK